MHRYHLYLEKLLTIKFIIIIFENDGNLKPDKGKQFFPNFIHFFYFVE